jgi:hypothetical protein
MKTALLLVLLAANGIAFALVTTPARDELKKLQSQSEDLGEAYALRSEELVQWKELHSLVRLSRSTLEPKPIQRNGRLSALQAALLQAERDLAIRRRSMDIRLESETPAGFWGYRVDMEVTGDFANIYAYLDRVSQSGAPMALVRMALDEDTASLLRLTVTWTTLWPE